MIDEREYHLSKCIVTRPIDLEFTYNDEDGDEYDTPIPMLDEVEWEVVEGLLYFDEFGKNWFLFNNQENMNGGQPINFTRIRTELGLDYMYSWNLGRYLWGQFQQEYWDVKFIS
jgi:hypothetical protein